MAHHLVFLGSSVYFEVIVLVLGRAVVPALPTDRASPFRAGSSSVRAQKLSCMGGGVQVREVQQAGGVHERCFRPFPLLCELPEV